MVSTGTGGVEPVASERELIWLTPVSWREITMNTMKKMLTTDQLDTQSVMELPNRDMLLITVVITNLLNNLSVDVDVRNINVAVQVCAVVEALNTELLSTDSLTCTIQQRN
jgi:uncharacterized membrane protein